MSNQSNKTEKQAVTSKMVDYTGQTIHGYDVLYPLKRRAKNRMVTWRLKCTACGHERNIRSDQLAKHYVPFCPCQRASKQKLNEIYSEGEAV